MMGVVNWFLVISCVICGWAMLRIVGGENTRMLKTLEMKILRDAKKAAEATQVKVEEPLVVGSPTASPDKPIPGPAKPAGAATKPGSAPAKPKK